ncbi:protein of unknown function [Maridesulfovibrio hydrothermalis AM13 = DSM 14728]|uniref:Uncharacterized protein n=1 Tax=Maridesulfovibrio hydrothermalis AM13 = DSM 14728 TaxID=1121451 RepID=L0RCH9_9BACT|nr:protein of unknown function [Maridesulfovibrio hydrothermalis AM13 = DSM 14728]
MEPEKVSETQTSGQFEFTRQDKQVCFRMGHWLGWLKSEPHSGRTAPESNRVPVKKRMTPEVLTTESSLPNI